MDMGWYIISGVLLVVAIFGAGFFVGKKNGYRLAEVEKRLKDTLGK
jgi:hypothetical protein